MANVNVMSEKLINTSGARLNMQRHSNRIAIAENINKKLGKGSLTLEKKAALATCLENTRQICEATQSSAIPSKTFFLDMVASVIPNTIASEIVSVQAMEAKAGMISYLRFVYGSDKGATKANTMFNNSLYHGRTDMNYAGADVIGEALVDSNPFLQYAPVIPGTVVVNMNGTEIVDNGAGALGTATINYTTGEITGLTITSTDEVTADYKYNNEDIAGAATESSEGTAGPRVPYGVEVPQINLELAQLPVFAQSRKLAAYWGFDAAYDLKKQYGEDVTALMAAQAAGEIAYEIDTEICFDLYRMAGAGTELVWSKTQPVGVSKIDHYDSFLATLAEGDAAIFSATQRYNANFILVGTNVAAVVTVMRNFDGNNGSNAVGPHLIGTLGGKYKVYVIPQFNPDIFVMGFKGGNFLETGYVYAPYMPVLSTQMLTTANMVGQQGYATSYGKRMVNNKLYCKGRIVD